MNGELENYHNTAWRGYDTTTQRGNQDTGDRKETWLGLIGQDETREATQNTDTVQREHKERDNLDRRRGSRAGTETQTRHRNQNLRTSKS